MLQALLPKAVPSFLPDPFPVSKMNEHFEYWLKALRFGENIWVTFAPYTDRDRRLNDFLLYAHNKKIEYTFYSLRLSSFFENTTPIEHTTSDVQIPINKKSEIISLIDQECGVLDTTTQPCVVVVRDAELLFSMPETVALHLQSIFENRQEVVFLFLSESSVSKKSIPTNLYQNHDIYPLYDRTGANQFILYLQKKFEVSISKKEVFTIIEHCGGHPWLIKEAVRLHAKGKTDFKNENSFKLKIETFFHSLSEDKHLVLSTLFAKRTVPTHLQRTYERLMQIGLLHKGSVTIQGLSPLVEKKLVQSIQLEVVAGEIFLGGARVTHLFSERMQVLVKYIFQNQRRIITRDELTNIIWPSDDEEYSDWAFDQIISRFRQQLQELGFPLSVFKTLKGKGYYACFS